LDVTVIRNKINQNFKYFFESFLLLPPNLTKLQTDDVYQKFIEFYLNGNEVLSQDDVYQLIEVSNTPCHVVSDLRLRQGEARVVGESNIVSSPVGGVETHITVLQNVILLYCDAQTHC
jgi:hypothetical protein